MAELLTRENTPAGWGVYWQGPDALGPAGKKLAALTFDDGPETVWTPQVLDVLAHYGVKATFMCLGILVRQNPHVLRRMAREGHIIGNHSWDHPFLTQVSDLELRVQLERTTQEIGRAAGLRPFLFRPPYGEITVAAAHEAAALNYAIVQWSINSFDYDGLTASQVAANILPHIQPGSIILQHCAAYDHTNSLAGTVDALPEIIETLTDSGYSLVTIPELLDIPAYL